MSNSSSRSSYSTFSSTSSKPPAKAPHLSGFGWCHIRILPWFVVEARDDLKGCHWWSPHELNRSKLQKWTLTWRCVSGSRPPSSALASCPSFDISQIYILCPAGSAEPSKFHEPTRHKSITELLTTSQPFSVWTVAHCMPRCFVDRVTKFVSWF